MDTILFESAVIVKPESPETIIETSNNESGDITTAASIPIRKFGLADLWNIRKNGRYFNIHGK